MNIETHSATRRTFAFLGLVLGIFLLVSGTASAADSRQPSTVGYAPKINAADFSTHITNKYFSLPVGMKMTYKGEIEDGTETIELSIDGETKTVMGVKTLVYHDRVWLDGELIEDTRDYLAQDKEGNVWYFGENVNNYEDGKLKDTHGTWIAGVDGALPGIWMKAQPKVGESYLQEYYKGEAEDFAKVLGVNETVKVPYGTLTGCVKTLDSNPFDGPTADEYKFYCPQVKGFALEITVENGERIELITSTQGGVAQAHEDGDADKIAKMQQLIGLLKQLITLLLQQRGV